MVRKQGSVSKTTHYRRLRQARRFGCSVDRLPDGRGKHAQHPSGSGHPRWNADRMVDSLGYVLLRVGREHPLADLNGYAREHDVVVVAAMGRPLRSGEVVHHKNGDRQDNRIENLSILLRGQHNHIHNQDQGRDAEGRFIGKKKAGRLLDGREWDEMPEAK